MYESETKLNLHFHQSRRLKNLHLNSRTTL